MASICQWQMLGVIWKRTLLEEAGGEELETKDSHQRSEETQGQSPSAEKPQGSSIRRGTIGPVGNRLQACAGLESHQACPINAIEIGLVNRFVWWVSLCSLASTAGVLFIVIFLSCDIVILREPS